MPTLPFRLCSPIGRAALLLALSLVVRAGSAQQALAPPHPAAAAVPSVTSANVTVIDQAERIGPGSPLQRVDLFDTVERPQEVAEPVQRTWRVSFDLIGTPSGLALYLPGVIGHVRIGLNDRVLLDTITTPGTPPPRSIDRLRLLDLPPDVLQPAGNRLDVTLQGEHAITMSRLLIGARGALIEQRDDRATLMLHAPVVAATLIGCLGLSVLLLWLRRRQDTVYGCFAVSALSWGVHTAWGVSPRWWLPQPFQDVLWTAWYGFVVASLAVFALRFAGYRALRTERALLGFVIAIVPALFVARPLGLAEAVDSTVRLALVVIAFAGLGAVARAAARQRSVDSALLVLSGLAAAGFGARDWWAFQFQADSLPVQWAPFAGLPFAALMTWALIDRFVRAAESAEQLNRELEHRVQAKSAELVSALAQMRYARDAAEAADQAKTRFLAAASHDLRQPIHALGLYLGALRGRPLDEAARDLADRMNLSLAALDSLFNALLDISRIDAGTLVPAIAPFDLAALLHRLAHEQAASATARGLRLAVHIGRPSTGPQGRVTTASDPQLVERILRNLLDNAVKYTRHGGVLLSARQRRVGLGQALWRVEVWDTGPGIAPDQQERVFEEFYQVGDPGNGRHTGLGLGLSIVRRVAQLLGAPLALHSQPDRGSRFVLDLPACASVPAVPEPEAETSLQGLAVALIEDDADVRDAMQRLLQGWGCRVIVGGHAGEVVQLAAGAPVDVVVADLRLADNRDGLVEVGLLRQSLGRELPALLVSGDSAPERVRQIQRSGLPWLPKPLPPQQLRQWLAMQRPATPVAAP